MNKEKNKSILEKLLNKEAIYNMGIFLQFVTLFLLIIFVISSLFIKEFTPIVEFLVGVTLLFMAYNNYNLTKRKGFTILYSLTGIVFVVTSILKIYGS